MSILKNRMGIPGLLAILALVMAMGGAAWAAKKYVITSTNQIKPSVLKKLKGKPGPPGPAGQQGPAGAAGKDGTNGTNGKDGEDGTDGTNGTNGTDGEDGKSVELIGGAAGCPSDGTTVQLEGEPSTAKEVCNGETGFTEVLPEGKTETGTYFLNSVGVGSQAYNPISFDIPVFPAPTKATYVTGTSATGCPGIVNGTPTADPGNLCLYKGNQNGGAEELIPGEKMLFIDPQSNGNLAVQPNGTLAFIACESGSCTWWGSWAVTAAVTP